MHRKSVIIMLVLLLVLTGCSKGAKQVALENVEVGQETEEESETQDSIFVFVCGGKWVVACRWSFK